MAEQRDDTIETSAAPVADGALPDAPQRTPKMPEAKAVLAAPAETIAVTEAAAEAPAPRPRPRVQPKSQPVVLQAATSSPASAPKPAPAAPDAMPRAAKPASAERRYPLRAAGVALAIGLGVAGGAYALSRPAGESPETALKQWTDAAGASLRQNQEDVTRLSGDVRALKVAVESLKEGLDRSKGEGARNGQLAERLDRTDRATGEIAVKLGKLSEQLDRVERGEKEGVAKVSLLHETKATQLNERFERLERQVSAAANSIAAIQTAPKPSPAPAQTAEPSQTASLASRTEPRGDARTDARGDGRTDPRLDPRTAPVDGFVIRDVYDGMALIEGRNNRLYEVSPGSNIPGVGRVEAVERRGKAWVVLTAKGVIPMGRF